ncbi:hypothetical protein D1007_26079 [Hordeum vulgare]|nr:hypothetical protein D1007_26079 [Hordeum vulgare]
MKVAAQKLISKGMRIVHEREGVTEAGINEFHNRFKQQLTDEMIKAMRKIFKLDDVAVTAMEEALIVHGGPANLDHDGQAPAADA